MTERRRSLRKVLPNGRSAPDVKHVRLYRWLLKSPAWQDLGLAARCLYIELSSRYTGENNGEIVLGVRDAADRLHVCKNTAHKAFRELEDHCFIRPKVRGSFTQKGNIATTWILTEYPLGGGVASRDFMRWCRNTKHGPF